MKNVPERRGEPQRQSTEAAAPLQNFRAADQLQKVMAAEQQHQNVEDGTTTHQEMGGEVYFGSEIHRAAQKFEKKEKKTQEESGKKLKTENSKLFDVAVDSI